MDNTREKLIELICSTEYGNGSLIGKNFQKGFIEKIADHLIANGVTVQKWIPVTERLPEEPIPVLAWSKYGVLETARWTGHRWEVTWDLQELAEVSHWMPLPEPPKED